MPTKLKTPVAVIIFNRPKCTRRVFEAIRKAHPQKLYIIADGPRSDRDGEDLLCSETREVIDKNIDWSCDVVRDYADHNLGCGKRLPSGLTNMFKIETQAIILEDDVLPHPSFFAFAESMLEKYVDESKIMQVCGYNQLNCSHYKDINYFYSRYSDIWGWATWKRAWQCYDDLNKETWEKTKQSGEFDNLCFSLREAEMRKYTLDRIFAKDLDAWGMRWDVAKVLNKGLGILPSVNLVANIGFGKAASHTVNPFNLHRFNSVGEIYPPYQGPTNLQSNTSFDDRYNRKMFSRHVAIERFRAGLLRIMGKA